jgi:hypothetical protein
MRNVEEKGKFLSIDAVSGRFRAQPERGVHAALRLRRCLPL